MAKERYCRKRWRWHRVIWFGGYGAGVAVGAGALMTLSGRRSMVWRQVKADQEKPLLFLFRFVDRLSPRTPSNRNKRPPTHPCTVFANKPRCIEHDVETRPDFRHLPTVTLA